MRGLALVPAAAALALSACGAQPVEKLPPAVSSAASSGLSPAQTGAAVMATRPFSATSPWNTPVDGLAADPGSARMLALASGKGRAPGIFVNSRRWTVPVFYGRSGTPVRVVCRQRRCGPGARGLESVMLPPDGRPLPQYDGWITVVDAQRDVAFDFWRARRKGAVMSYSYVKRWDLSGPGYGPPATRDPVNAVSARGSGLPLFAGLIDPEEIAAGHIDHALAISVPDPAAGRFVRPASTTNGLGPDGSLPEGARLRLRNVKLGRLPGGANRRTAGIIARALARYGAIVVDRSDVPTLFARRNARWDGVLAGNELQGFDLTDFEVVDLGAHVVTPAAAAEGLAR